MPTKVVLIHGVGNFDAIRTTHGLQSVLEEFHLGSQQFLPVDWCRVAGDSFANLPRVGKAILRMPYMRPTCEFGSKLRRIVAASSSSCFLATQILSLTVLPILIATWFSKSVTIIKLVLSLMAALFGLGCLGEIARGRVGFLHRCVRRIAFILCWPLMHTVAAPSYLQPEELVFRVVGALAYVALPLIIFGLLSGTFWLVFGLTVVAAGFVLITVACSIAIFFVFYVTAYVIVKVFADVVLWIGDAEYRNTIRHAVARTVSKLNLSREDTLVLATHSLGSVIGLDYLVSYLRAGEGPQRIVIITCGSPLASLFHGFLPEFFGSPSTLCRHLQRKFETFRWINVYRPLDPIGRRLGISDLPCGFEASTKEWHRLLLLAHINYWPDKEVINAIRSGLVGWSDKLSEVSGANEDPIWPKSGRVSSFEPSAKLWNYGKQVSALFYVAALIAVGGLFIGSVNAARKNFENIESHGIAVEGLSSCDLNRVDRNYATSTPEYLIANCNITFTTNGTARHGERNAQHIDISPFKDTKEINRLLYTPLLCKVSIRHDLHNPDNFVVERYHHDSDLASFLPRQDSNPNVLNDSIRQANTCRLLQADGQDWDEKGPWLWVWFPLVLLVGLAAVLWQYSGLPWSASLVGAEPKECWDYFCNKTNRLLRRDN